MTAKITRMADGRWAVIWCSQIVAGPFGDEASARRALDSMTDGRGEFQGKALS